MARSARKLAAMLRSEGWTPRQNIRSTRTFEHISEACGCDIDGRAVPGRRPEMHLGDDADGYNIKDLFEHLVVNRGDGQSVGRSFIQEFFDPRNQRNLWEAGGAMSAVDSTAFTGIMGQLLIVDVLKPYDKEEYVVRKLIPTYNSPFEQEKIPGIAPPKDPSQDMLLAAEMEPLTYVGFGENYILTPLTRKSQKGIALTKEAIFFDRTGQITQQAETVGDLLAFAEERECIGCVIGGTTDPVYYVEKRQIDSGPVTLDLFQEASASSGARQLAYAFATREYPFVNDVPSNPLADYKAVRQCDRYFSDIVDPNRGRPIVIGKPFILAPHTKRIDVARVLEASNILQLTQAGVNTVGALFTGGPNPLGTVGLTPSSIAVSRLLHQELVRQLSLSHGLAQEIWFYGDIARAFRYVTNWPIQVLQAPLQSEAEFDQDIVMRWKATKRGRCAIFEPRCWTRNNYLSETSDGV
jgi:hypothetical protein